MSTFNYSIQIVHLTYNFKNLNVGDALMMYAFVLFAGDNNLFELLGKLLPEYAGTDTSVLDPKENLISASSREPLSSIKKGRQDSAAKTAKVSGSSDPRQIFIQVEDKSAGSSSIQDDIVRI